METSHYILFSSYLLTILFGFYTIKHSDYIGRVALSFVILSTLIDAVSIYYASSLTNNLFYINLYEYLAFPIEISILLLTKVINKIFVVLSIFLIIGYWIIHLLFNLQNGFDHFSKNLSYGSSVILCIYFGIIILLILTNHQKDFEKHKLSFLILGGIFIFETNLSVIVLKFKLQLSPQEDLFLSQTYYITNLIATVIKNTLFTLYFIFTSQQINISLNQKNHE